MSTYTAHVQWRLGTQADAAADFTRSRYSRRHSVRFDGGVEMPASSSPSVVPLPWSDAAAVDPEEMFVASLSSCHMLWFLSLAAEAGHAVQSYSDQAEGTMARNAQRQMVVTQVVLHPQVEFAGAAQPSVATLADLHQRAHEACFIANSVKTEVLVQPR
jgi:organic hydroperoxide reductase OsmC/OhrA